jgi:hypothetical protein
VAERRDRVAKRDKGIPSPSIRALSGIVVSVLAIGPKVSGFKPGRRRLIFKGDKNLWHDLKILQV